MKGTVDVQKDGEPSVEDILRSIKKVISREDEGFRGPAVDGESPPAPAPGFGTVRAFTPRDAFGRPTFGQPLTSVPAASPPANAEPPAATSPATTSPLDADPEPIADEVYDLGNEPEADEVPAMEAVALPAGFEPPAEAEPPAESDADENAADGVAGDAQGAQVHEAYAQPTDEPAQGAPASQPAAPSVSEGLIAGATAAAMRDQLGALSSLTAAATRAENPPHPLEDVVRDMLRPMLKEWLDANLQGIIERMVQDEIARITGRR